MSSLFNNDLSSYPKQYFFLVWTGKKDENNHYTYSQTHWLNITEYNGLAFFLSALSTEIVKGLCLMEWPHAYTNSSKFAIILKICKPHIGLFIYFVWTLFHYFRGAMQDEEKFQKNIDFSHLRLNHLELFLQFFCRTYYFER